MLTIRPCAPDDTAAIQRLIADVYAEYALVMDLEGEDTHLIDPGPYFRSRGGEFWVVEDAGRILATAAVKLHEDAGELKALYVDPSIRRQGWGRRLTELAMDHARQTLAGRTRRGLKAALFVLWSDTRFTKAHALYREMGFACIGTRALHDLNNTTEYGFAMPL